MARQKQTPRKGNPGPKTGHGGKVPGRAVPPQVPEVRAASCVTCVLLCHCVPVSLCLCCQREAGSARRTIRL